MNSEKEITSYENVYFDYGFDIKTQIKDFEFPSLVKFLIQWRNDKITKTDPLFRTWLTSIAPSCVYKRSINSNDINEKTFVCYYCESKTFQRPGTLIRHYRENHFEMIPNGIFGEKIVFKCEDCNLEFTRKEYLTVHKQSEKHLKKVDPEGLLAKKRNNESNEESDQFFQKTKVLKENMQSNDEPVVINELLTPMNPIIDSNVCELKIPNHVSEELQKVGLLDCEQVENNILDNKENESLNQQAIENQTEANEEIARSFSEILENEIQNTQPIDQPQTSTQNDAQTQAFNLQSRSGSLKMTEGSSKKLVKVLSENLESNLKL
jgi:hypothetical protein